ncbi:MAG: 30S ribosomal protein S16 [Proteobacteria bacterium]|jgi:small subunit ribosomal protein S16|nr:30S ribosomal protein S16 [Pseudomonadota bacterium]MDA1300631.1 30S ribosomal protein S16 [Pseudomonadota bacterium]
MVTIRLARAGSKKRPFYHITVADRRRARDSSFVERLGFYNPGARGAEETSRIDVDRYDYWVRLGAQPSDRVRSLIKAHRKAEAAAAESGSEQAA